MQLRSRSKPRTSRSSHPHSPSQRASHHPTKSFEEEASPRISACRTHRKSPGRTNKLGLQSHLDKQLIQDIQASGGRGSFSLAHICDRKQEIYGSPRSSLRRKVANRSDYLRKLSNAEYAQLVSHYGLLPTSTHEESSPPEASPPPSPRPFPEYSSPGVTWSSDTSLPSPSSPSPSSSPTTSAQKPSRKIITCPMEDWEYDPVYDGK